MKLHIMQFSPISRHLIPLRSKNSVQHPVLNHPQYMVLPLMSETKFQTHTKLQAREYERTLATLWKKIWMKGDRWQYSTLLYRLHYCVPTSGTPL
jgi:hypothetical protein